MKIVPIKVDKFNEGISDDVRDQLNGVFALTKNFDIFTSKKRLIPYRDTLANSGISSTNSTMATYAGNSMNFAYDNTGLYAMAGLNAGTPARFRLFVKTDPTGNGSNWAISSTGSQTTIGSAGFAVMLNFKDYLWGIKGSAAGTSNKADIWQYGLLSTGAKVLTETYGGADVLTGSAPTSAATASNGIIGDDDNGYLPYGNKLAKINGATLAITAARLTLPSNYTISSLSKWGKYLAIGCYPSNLNDVSKMFIWDYVSDDVTEAIPFGKGNLKVLENIDGKMIGLIDRGSTSAVITNKIEIWEWAGGNPSVIKEIDGSDLACFKQSKGNKLYFVMTDGVTYGIWILGRRVGSDPIAVTFDRPLSNDTAITTRPKNFFMFGDYLFVGLSDGNVRRTSDQAGTYTTTCFYKSQKFNAGDLEKVKVLKNARVGVISLLNGATLKLDYRVNATSTDLISTWTQIVNETVAGTYVHEALKNEITDREFQDGNEFEFRSRTTGGAEITGFGATFEVVDSQIEE